jgi:TetR/AcrR family fatty acid metabolism transcriptional regulator
MKEYANPRFAEFLKLLAGVIDEGQREGAIRRDVPANVAARGLFGLLDELALMWVTQKGERLDIKKVAEWVGDVVLQGLEARRAA